jgi:type I restriction enzyme M protein
MNEIHAELAMLNKEANVLMNEIQKAWEDMK